jgi:hypothetical protein
MPHVVHTPDPIVDGATLALLRVADVSARPLQATTADAIDPLGVHLDVTLKHPRSALDRVMISHRTSQTPRRRRTQRVLSP